MTARSFEDADDVAATLTHRVTRYVDAMGYPGLGKDQLISGLFPRATGISDPDIALALDDRARAIEQRARVLAEIAVERGDIWVQEFGNAPEDSDAHDHWVSLVAVGAAYRELWSINGSGALFQEGIGPNDQANRQRHVIWATQQARNLSDLRSARFVAAHIGLPEHLITAPSATLGIDF